MTQLAAHPRPGHFTPNDVIWRVQQESVLMLAGGRAFLLQAAHPLALAAFAAHSTYHVDPFERLWRTMGTVWAAVFGTPEEAERAGTRVRAMHGQVTGTLDQDEGPFPAGTPYAADDPELLMWIQATLYDTSLLAFETFVRPLSDSEHDDFYEQMGQMAQHWGVPYDVLPPDRHAFREYWDEMLASDVICVTERTLEMGRIILEPPAPVHVRAGWPALNLITAGMLPASLRNAYGLPWGPARRRMFAAEVAAIRAGRRISPRRARVLRQARAAERRFA